ncbi:hypothetical protein ACLX1H_000559 [Fusarium chlamydosporum]
MGNDGGSFNCPGVLRNGNDNDNKAYCCVGGELDLSTCEGWPICTGSSWSPKPITCAASVPVTIKDYSAQIKSASSKYLQDGNEPGATTNSVSSATAKGSGDNQATTASATNTAVQSATTSNGASLKMPRFAEGLVGTLVAL